MGQGRVSRRQDADHGGYRLVMLYPGHPILEINTELQGNTTASHPYTHCFTSPKPKPVFLHVSVQSKERRFAHHQDSEDVRSMDQHQVGHTDRPQNSRGDRNSWYPNDG